MTNATNAEKVDAIASVNNITDSVVRALIPLSSDAPEADRIVQEFKHEFFGPDTVDLLKKKYDYVATLFYIDINARYNCPSVGATDMDKAATNYYSLLSVLILRKWG